MKAAALAVGLALALAGCGGAAHTTMSSAHTPTHPPTTAAATPSTTVLSGHASIAIQNFMFQPEVVTVRVGTRVTWTQDDASVHTVTDQGVFASGPLAQGATYSHVYVAPGTYRYICSIHMYMVGTVRVVA